MPTRRASASSRHWPQRSEQADGNATSPSATKRSARRWSRRQQTAALEAYQKDVASTETLVDNDPGDARWQRELTLATPTSPPPWQRRPRQAALVLPKEPAIADRSPATKASRWQHDLAISMPQSPDLLAQARPRALTPTRRHSPRRIAAAIKPTPSCKAISPEATTTSQCLFTAGKSTSARCVSERTPSANAFRRRSEQAEYQIALAESYQNISAADKSGKSAPALDADQRACHRAEARRRRSDECPMAKLVIFRYAAIGTCRRAGKSAQHSRFIASAAVAQKLTDTSDALSQSNLASAYRDIATC